VSVPIAIFAGEASGDILGASLIRALRRRVPEAGFFGIAGPLMQQEGCRTLYPMERLSVMGLFESFGRYPELIPLRRKLLRTLRRERPRVLIGIDAPDFNLSLERGVRRAGVPTVHYVSPSVWAWRRYRMSKIRHSVDLMLTVFPFEAGFFRRYGVPVSFVGHPLAVEIPLEAKAEDARECLGLAGGMGLVAMLPGSRASEVAFLARPMIETARWLVERRPGLQFVVPLVNEAVRARFLEAHRECPGAPAMHLVDGRSRDCMQSADVVLVASGTACLEAMLLKKPMVITFRATALTYWIMRHWIGSNIRFAGLANLLADRLVVAELMQRHATSEWLGPAVLRLLDSGRDFQSTREEYVRLHRVLRRGAADRAAEEIVALIEGRARVRVGSASAPTVSEHEKRA